MSTPVEPISSPVPAGQPPADGAPVAGAPAAAPQAVPAPADASAAPTGVPAAPGAGLAPQAVPGADGVPVPAPGQPRRARLRLYLGAAPGVGKTYAMLADARRRRREGGEVLVGAAETHGWQETAEQLAGLEILPPLMIEHRGAKLPVFDLDAALARRPALLLVDDLAQANPPGCRHAQRWQDVRELLDAGIDVHSTLGIHNLESLNHLVERITGLEIRERVPDSIFERADELELVDAPPEEILRRLRAGGIGQARAGEGPLSLNHLVALRELSLRITAERVHAQVQTIRRARVDAPTVPTMERLLVCVGASPFSARLVRAARRMASGLRAEWVAVYVETPASRRLPEGSRLTAIQNLRLAELLGAETVSLTGEDVAAELIAFARLRNVSKIVIGKSPDRRWYDRFRRSLAHELVRRSGGIDVYVIDGDQGDKARPPRLRPELPFSAYLVALEVIAGITLACWFLRAGLSEVTLIVVYLLGVVLVAARGRRGPAALAALAALAAFDYAYVPPLFAFGGLSMEHAGAFTAILVVGVLVSTLAVRLRHQVESAYQREARTAALHAVSRDLAITRGIDNLLSAASRHGTAMLSCPVTILLPDAGGRLTARGGERTRCPAGSPDLVAAQWAFANAKPAGVGTGTLKRVEALHVPLVASHGTIGVLSLFVGSARQVESPERRNLIEAFAHQVALAVECDNLVVRAQQAQFEVESERLRNALLSSVSHDLRTPLAAITGAASSLVEQDTLLDHEARRDLAETISEEAEHMARLVSNLLDMTRLEGGNLRLKKDPHPLEDVVGAALTVLERRLLTRAVAVDIPLDMPPVPLDGILIQEVLINLIENALKYTPPGSPLTVRARQVAHMAEISVEDGGPGLAADELERVFEKFYRGASLENKPGVGLGLAICRGIIEAHGGRIRAENLQPRGAAFRFTLPLGADGVGAAAEPAGPPAPGTLSGAPVSSPPVPGDGRPPLAPAAIPPSIPA